MNYLWEVMLQAKRQGLPKERIRFQTAKEYSAYMEVAGEFLNQTYLEDRNNVEINPYYRFFDIFRDMFEPDLVDCEELRESLTNLILHQLAENDIVSGMTKEEYYKKLLYRDLEEVFGRQTKEQLTFFNNEEKEILLSGMLIQYETGNSLDLFTDIIETMMPDNIIYHSNHTPYEILIYINRKKEKKLAGKVDFLIHMFAGHSYKIEIYYEYHFGIMGVDETMVIDEIAMC